MYIYFLMLVKCYESRADEKLFLNKKNKQKNMTKSSYKIMSSLVSFLFGSLNRRQPFSNQNKSCACVYKQPCDESIQWSPYILTSPIAVIKARSLVTVKCRATRFHAGTAVDNVSNGCGCKRGLHLIYEVSRDISR